MTDSRFLSPEDCGAWLKKWNYSLDPPGEFFFSEEMRTSEKSSRQCAFVIGLLNWLPEHGECLLWVTTWGVWAENAELFRRVRSPSGDGPLVHEAPGQILDLADRSTVECLLDICIYNLWDVGFYDSLHRFHLSLSHDEFILIECNEALSPSARITYEEYRKD